MTENITFTQPRYALGKKDKKNQSQFLPLYIFSELPEFLANGRLPATQTVTITQNPLVISCHVRGRPLPEITWFKDEVAIGGDQGGLYYVRTIQQPIETFSYNVTSSLLFQGQPIKKRHAFHMTTYLYIL